MAESTKTESTSTKLTKSKSEPVGPVERSDDEMFTVTPDGEDFPLHLEGESYDEYVARALAAGAGVYNQGNWEVRP